MRKRNGGDEGAAMVEFALIAPVLIMLVMGIVEFGRAYNTQISIQAAAREGARAAAVHKSSGEVSFAVTDAAPTVVITSISQTACPATGDGKATVTVTNNFTFGIPFVPLGNKTLTATAVMRCEG